MDRKELEYRVEKKRFDEYVERFDMRALTARVEKFKMKVLKSEYYVSFEIE